jgi:hypothetical protein
MMQRSRILTRCIYADPANSNQFNQGHSGLLAQMYLLLSKSGQRGSAGTWEFHPPVDMIARHFA